MLSALVKYIPRDNSQMSLVLTYPQILKAEKKWEDVLRHLDHLYNLESVKSTHGGVLLLVKLQVTLLHGCFSRFLNCFLNCANVQSIIFLFEEKLFRSRDI